MNKKGFTLIEVMTAVLIIVAIALISFPVLINIMQKNKDIEADTFKENAVLAAKTYFNLNKDKFILNDSGYAEVTVQTLIDEGYLDETKYDYDYKDEKVTCTSINECEYQVNLDKEMRSFQESAILAAKTYFKSYREKFILNDEGFVEISLNTLIKEGYLEKPSNNYDYKKHTITCTSLNKCQYQTVRQRNYKVGDLVTLNNDDYYIINLNGDEDYVTLLKANPLTVSEVNEYGVGHINRYTYNSVGTAYNMNGYGGMAYYSSETCGCLNGSWVGTSCTTDYNQSEIKYAVDAWAVSKFTNGELATDTNGYKARLITTNELESLGCVYSSASGYYPLNDNIPSWIWNSNYVYWTMSPYNSSIYVWGFHYGGYVSYYDIRDGRFGVARPVINVYKSRL